MRSADRTLPLGVAAFLGPAFGDLLEEADREEVAKPVDARAVRRVAVLLVEAAELPALLAAELVEAALVARVVDRPRHASPPPGRQPAGTGGGAQRTFVRLPVH